jgi:hypothetical protein
MGSSTQQTWCHKTIKAKNNHYSGNFLLLRPGENDVSLRVLIFNKKTRLCPQNAGHKAAKEVNRVQSQFKAVPRLAFEIF